MCPLFFKKNCYVLCFLLSLLVNFYYAVDVSSFNTSMNDLNHISHELRNDIANSNTTDLYGYYKFYVVDDHLRQKVIGNYHHNASFVVNHGIFLLNFTSDKVLNAFVYEIYLPKQTIVNYIRSNCKMFIESDQDNFFIHGFCNNKKVILLLQFSFSDQQSYVKHGYPSLFSSYSFSLFLLVIAVFLGVTIVYLFYLHKNKRFSLNSEDNIDFDLSLDRNFVDEFNKHILPKLKLLNDTQSKVFLLILISEQMYPNEIAKVLGMNKSTVSRTIKKLERLSLISTKKIGKRLRIFLPNYIEKSKKLIIQYFHNNTFYNDFFSEIMNLITKQKKIK